MRRSSRGARWSARPRRGAGCRTLGGASGCDIVELVATPYEVQFSDGRLRRRFEETHVGLEELRSMASSHGVSRLSEGSLGMRAGGGCGARVPGGPPCRFRRPPGRHRGVAAEVVPEIRKMRHQDRTAAFQHFIRPIFHSGMGGEPLHSLRRMGGCGTSERGLPCLPFLLGFGGQGPGKNGGRRQAFAFENNS